MLRGNGRLMACSLLWLGALLCSSRTKVHAAPKTSVQAAGKNTNVDTNTSVFLTQARSALRQWKFGASLHYLAQCIRSSNATRGEKLEASTLRARVHQTVGQILAGMKDAKVSWAGVNRLLCECGVGEIPPGIST